MPVPIVTAAFNDSAIAHGFFGRRGGVSQGQYASLNAALGNGDAANALVNRARIAAAMGLAPSSLVSLDQQGGNRVFSLTMPWSNDRRPQGDAMVTDTPGIGLGVLTADCAPVLMAGRAQDGRPVVGAAHAGREGTLRAVLEFTLVAMNDLGVRNADVTAVIGPCIGPDSYELSLGDEKPFLAEDPAAWEYFRPGRAGHVMMDLPGYCAHRLRRAGVANIHTVGRDTMAEADMFFSYRRSRLANETGQGLQMSVIAIAPV